MSSTDDRYPRWHHNDDDRRWELLGYGPIVLSWITDEFLRDVALSREQLEELVLGRFGLQLPDEAYERAGR